MKIIQPFNRKFYVKAWHLLSPLLLFVAVMSFTGPVHSQEQYPIEYTEFLTKAENVFLFHPELVRDVFYSLIDLKGNRATARNRINRDVLGCRRYIEGNRGCRIKKLKMEQKAQGLTGSLEVPVNFTYVQATRHTRTKQRIHLRWRPELIKPPAISLQDFLEDVWAAKESKYFKFKQGIERIQLNPILERDIYFVTDNRMADSLVGVYKQLPTDKQDSITFIFDYSVPTKRHITMDFFVHLKADKVIMNKHTFYPVERKKHW